MEIITLKHKTVRAYIINSNGIYIMVDSGYPESLKIFDKMLADKNMTFSQINYLVITHFHPDHAGLVQQLLDYGIQLLLHENQKEYIHWINNYFQEHIHQKYKPIIENNNDKITVLDTESSASLFEKHKINGKIIFTPGHTNDSVTFIINDAAFIGDLTKYNETGIYTSKIAEDSWNKILKNKIGEIYPGHGEKYKISMGE